MRILNVNMSLDPLDGGTAERTFQLSRNLSLLKEEVVTLVLDKGLSEQRKALCGGKVVALKTVHRRFYLPSLGSIRAIQKEVKNADVIHLMGNWTLINAVVYFFARRYQKPYLFCPAGALQILGRSRTLKQIYRRFITRPLLKNASKLIAISENEIPVFLQEGAEKSKIVSIPNAVDPQEYILDAPHPAPARSNPYILFLGRLDFVKGPDLGLEAFHKISARFPEYSLYFAGPDGGMEAALMKQAESFGIKDRVRFLGLVRSKDKTRLLTEAKLLMIPSRSEAMSIVALEAGMCKTPVLLTDRCGFDEIAKINGGRVAAVAADSIAKELELLLQNPEELVKMGHHLHQWCQENFTWSIRSREYLAQIRNAFDGNS